MSDVFPPRALASGEDLVLICEEPRNLAQRISDRVTIKPDGIIRSYAIDGLHRTDTYSSLWRRAGDIAAALASAGAKPSCSVVILVEDIVDFLPAFWACLRGGFIAIALTSAAKDFLYRDEEVFGTALGLLSNRFFLVDGFFEGATKLSETFSGPFVALSAVGPAPSWTDHGEVQDPACLVATSGSTGTLKLVALSHATLIYRNYARTKVFDTDARHAIGTFPLDGITGQHAIYLHYDSWTQLASETITREPCAILNAIEAFDGGVVSLTSSMVRIILDADAREPRPRQLGCIKLIGVGAEPVAIKPLQEFAELLRRYGASPHVLKAGYGTTETGSLVKGSDDFLGAELHDAVCLGHPFAGVAMRIVDDQGTVLEQGAIGELEVSCPEKLFSGYWGDLGLTRDGFATDGWWKTGDLGQIVDDKIFLRGRAKDVLILSGKKFSLADIDAELRNVLIARDTAYGCVVAADGRESLAVIYAVADVATSARVEQEIKNALARRFGIHPSRLMRIDADRFPKTASGKIRRNVLGALLADDKEADRHLLAKIWNTSLGQEGPVHADANFFAQGGDSLRSLTMHLQILDAFHINISSDLFFANPTFDNLLQRIRSCGVAGPAQDDEASISWPLPNQLEKSLLAALETWPGERPTPGRTMLAVNSKGTKPPVFWVFNDPSEPIALAKNLGDAQPLYAFRSGVAVSDYREDDIQALALRYLADIIAIYPEGPFFIGGNCQGAIIALAMAQHALRRKRHVPLLVLMDWAFALQPYRGPVLLVAGRQNNNHNAMRLFARPELAWQRAFASYEFVEIPGGYAEGFTQGSIDVLAELLNNRMESAISKPLPLMPMSGYQATVSAMDLAPTMHAGVRTTIKVVVTNDSEVPWGPTDRSGVVLCCRWLAESGAILGVSASSADLPAIAPKASTTVDLELIPPITIGHYTLNMELCEEGHRWFREPLAGFRVSLRVVHPKIRSPLKRFLRKVFGKIDVGQS
jgi:acyl-CoA synthetase (AMP-forming)/AMP-acid ligase II